MIKRLFPMEYLSISQGRNGTVSHKNLNAYDLNGKDTGIDEMYATCELEIISVHSYETTGYANTVHFYDKENDITWACSHINELSGLYLVGNKIKSGELAYKEGTKGKATGNHIHFELGKGKQAKKVNINGTVQLKNLINIEDYFYIDDSIKLRDTKGYNFEKMEGTKLNVIGQIITRIPLNDTEYEYRFSLDGNKYGTTYDKTSMKYFNDKALEKDGWKPYAIVNGSIFYTYDKATFAEGLEKSRGVNNQELEMACVSKFKDTMAIGFTYDGNIHFDKQSVIASNLDNYYGACTGMFGVMKNGIPCEWGKELESQRNNMYSNISGRTIVAFDAVNNYVVFITVPGTTGKSGIYGKDLYNLLKKHGCTDGVCMDGGGSVFLIVDGEDIVSTQRLVKNAILCYRRKKKPLEVVKNEDKEETIVTNKEEVKEEVKEEIKDDIKMVEEVKDVKEVSNDEVINELSKNEQKLNLIKEVFNLFGINFTVRGNNPIFWFFIALNILLPICSYAMLKGIVITNWQDIVNLLISALNNEIVVTAIVGSILSTINDPTTKGLTDSKRAKNYIKPN